MSLRHITQEQPRGALRDLGALPEYQDLWGGINDTTHPNEIFAALFAAMIVKDKFGGPDLPSESAAAGKDFATLRAWCREHFSGKAAPPDLMVCFALVRRCAIVASGTRKARAISPVARPPTARSVSATWDASDKAG